MKAKHTPGPWALAGKTTVATADLDSTIANISSFDRDDGEVEANARLISAAPDLLEALYLFTNHGGPKLHNNPAVDMQRRYEIARAATAKATGE